MNEEEELPDLVPNLNTDWVPPLPAKSKPNPSRFINNVLTYKEFAKEFSKKLDLSFRNALSSLTLNLLLKSRESIIKSIIKIHD